MGRFVGGDEEVVVLDVVSWWLGGSTATAADSLPFAVTKACATVL